MDAFRPAPTGYGLAWPRVDVRDLVVKVKYGDTLKRFNACVNGSHFDHDLPALRKKIASAFKFSPDAEFVLTYTDEDEDDVMLDDDNDLRDAAINQKLNPLRINVQLKSSNFGATQTKQQATTSKSLRSTSLEDQFAQVKSAIDEALKFVPEQVPAVLAKLSHDLRSRAASSAPSLAELLDRFAKLITRSSSMNPSYSSADGSQEAENSKVKLESAPMTGSTSEPSVVQNAGIPEAGLKSVLSEDPTVKIEQAPSLPSVDDSLVFTSSGGLKSDLKRSVDTEIKTKSDACSKGKSVISSVPPVSTTSHGAPTQRSLPVPSMGEKAVTSPTYTSCGSNGMANVDMLSLFAPPPPPVAYPPPPVLPPYKPNPIFGANGKTTGGLRPIFGANGKNTGGLPSTFPPPPNIYSPFKMDKPSSVGNSFPNLYSTIGSSHTDRMPSLFSGYVPTVEGNSYGSNYRSLGDNYGSSYTSLGGNYGSSYTSLGDIYGSNYRSLGENYGSILQRAQHRRIRCDGCGVTPIVGSRYKSNVKENYDLCGSCFPHMGNEAEYTRLDRPASKTNMKNAWWSPAGKTDCRFIKDVTIPDGTPMAPSTPFTKIWRMCNNGSTMWPNGTQLVWVGGDHLACLTSARLAISASRGLSPCEETDVTVDFLAPAKPGRYISYWRLVLPSGVKFGQQIWVHIQVEQPIQTSCDEQAAATNVKRILEASRTGPLTLDINSAPIETLKGWPFASLEPLSGWPRSSCTEWGRETMGPKKSEPAPSNMSPAITVVEPGQIPVTDAPASSSEAELASMPAGVPAPEAITLPNPVPMPGPVSAFVPGPAAAAPVSVPVAAHAPASVPAVPWPEETSNHLEEKLMGELEVLGFLQADLNKQILRQNNYDLELSVVDLCSINEWDPLELSELGSDDADMNKEEVVDNSDDEGFIVTNLMTKTKKDQ